MTAARFHDDGRTVYDFLDEILVECPRCASCAIVRPAPEAADAPPPTRKRPARPAWLRPRRMVCSTCGHVGEWAGRTLTFGGAVDPYFGAPLWLRASFEDHTVWAYNRAQLAVMREFVAARLRERDRRPGSARSVVERMPEWFGSAKHRAALTRTLDDMAARL